MKFDFKELKFKLIFECIGGSRLYGCSTENSDVDIRGVFIPSAEYFLGFMKRIKLLEDKVEDRVYYDIRKFLKMACDSNPNILELLFIPRKNWIEFTPEWEWIIEKRNYFLSKKAIYTFSGYAHSQLKKISNHRRWLFGAKPANRKELLAYNHWQEHRNPERKKMEEIYGFDLKHASHLYRLTTEGAELITTGFITFPRPDVDIILKIRNGDYKYEEVLEMVGDIDKKFEELSKISKLPHKPDRNMIDEICVGLVMDCITEDKNV